MSGRDRGRGWRRQPRGPPRGVAHLRQQVATLKAEMRTANTGKFTGNTHVISMPQWNRFANMYRTVRLQVDSSSRELSEEETETLVHGSSGNIFPEEFIDCTELLHDD